MNVKYQSELDIGGREFGIHYPNSSVGGHCGHGDGGDCGHDIGEKDDSKAGEDAGITHDPGQPEEQHHSPYIKQAPEVDTLEPAELDRLLLLGDVASLHVIDAFIAHLGAVHQLVQGRPHQLPLVD